MRWNEQTKRLRWSIRADMGSGAVRAVSSWCAARPQCDVEFWQGNGGFYLVTPGESVTEGQSLAVSVLRQVRCFDAQAHLGMMRMVHTPKNRIQ
jgi:hypothetical protein